VWECNYLPNRSFFLSFQPFLFLPGDSR